MIVMLFTVSKAQWMVRPIGSSFTNDFRTNAAFTTATKGRSIESFSVKSRPRFKGIPSAAKVPGATIDCTAFGAAVQSGFAGNGPIKYAPMESAFPGGAIVAPTANTPGTEATLGSISSKN